MRTARHISNPAGTVPAAARLSSAAGLLSAAVRLTLEFGALVLLAAGCERRPLEDPGYNNMIRVKVDVNAISNVTCDIYNDKIPVPEIDDEVMHVIFYGQDDRIAAESFISERSTDTEGNTVISGNIAVAPGTYKMLIWNFGTESTVIGDYQRFSLAEAYTNTVSDNILSRYESKVGENEIVVYEPDHLVVARNDRETIPYHSGVYTVQADARSVVETYYLQIKIDGLEYVASAQAFLSGMASGNLLSEGRPITDPQNTVYFTLLKSDDKGVPVVCNNFNTFGRIEDSDNQLQVTFDIRTKDGRTVQKSFDISDLFLSEDCIDHHWLLLEETIKIDPPENPGGGGGFDPGVEDWEDENHDIEL